MKRIMLFVLTLCLLLPVFGTVSAEEASAGMTTDGAEAYPDARTKDGAFAYIHDPRDNPAAMEDIIENPDAIYGFSPNPDSKRLGAYAEFDWTDPELVSQATEERRAYHEDMDSMTDILYRMRAEGASMEEMARAVSIERNRIRLESYRDDPEVLAKVMESNLSTYGHEDGPTPDQLYEKYGSWTGVLQKAFSTNMGMDACCGLYDEYYSLYIELDYVKADIVDEILTRGTLRVGTAGDYQPMSFLDPETGTYVGFDAELAKDLAAALGVELEYVPTSWPTLMEDTLAGKFDVAICGITITDARKEQALMSDGYLGNGKTVLCRAEDAEKYTSLEVINQHDVRVMENPGGLNEIFARENLPNATLIIHDVNQEIPGLVASGEADVMITEIMEAGYYVGQDSRLAAPLIYEPFTRNQLGILMPRGSENLLAFVNRFLQFEEKRGRLDELAEKYIYRYVQTEDEALPAA